jgi:hypothetical protein
LAERTGATGVQPNAAIPVKAPDVDYWAVHAGGGARLDGKPPAVLKDKDGNEVDVRKLRAEAAARRAAEQQQQAASSWKDLSKPEEAPKSETAPVSKRKSKIGSKYSRLKGSTKAFQGSANSIEDK